MAIHLSLLDKQIIKNIKEIREKLGISSYKIADYLNLTSSYVRNCEAQQNKYGIKHIVLITKLFKEYDDNITYDDLLGVITEEIAQDLIDNKRIKGKYKKDI